jgi:hypothetical protein
MTQRRARSLEFTDAPVLTLLAAVPPALVSLVASCDPAAAGDLIHGNP